MDLGLNVIIWIISHVFLPYLKCAASCNLVRCSSSAFFFTTPKRKSCGDKTRELKHCGEVDWKVMPHWPTLNEVILFITGGGGGCCCSAIFLLLLLLLLLAAIKPLALHCHSLHSGLSAAVRGSHVVHCWAWHNHRAHRRPATCPACSSPLPKGF